MTFGFFIQLDRSNNLSGGDVIVDVEYSGDPPPVPISKLHTLQGQQVPARLHQLLVEAGLTSEEAGGLVDSWEPQFFKTVGRRFLRIMSQKEYSCICPIQIDPPPTELVRVGIVLNEFGER